MEVSTLTKFLAGLPHLNGLRVRTVNLDQDGITVQVAAKRARAPCPDCRQPSRHVHSYYGRTVVDLPWSRRRVTLQVQSRRFRCRNRTCSSRVFCERLPALVPVYGRRSHDCHAALLDVAMALGGRPGARLADALALPTSRMTLVRLLCTTPAPPAGGRAPRVLGVDEWAFRRGRRYGSILVDLEQHRPVDLLPDATAVGFAAWLKMHPGAAIISRDRGGAFADGARAGAPNAIQVADRFHLLRNLGAVVKRVLQRHASRVQHVPAPPPLSRAPAPGDRASDTTRKRVGGEVTEVSLVARPERADRRASRARTKQTMQEHFEAVQRLAATGMASSAIARVLGLHRHTVQKYRRLSAPPERRHVSRHTSILAPYTGYLLERWRQGCRSAMRLWRELASRGYVGKYRSVARLVADWKRLERAGEAVPPPPPGLTPRQAAGLLLVRPQERTGEEQQAVDRLRTVHAEVAVAMTLFERFAQLIRAGTPRTPAAAAKRLAHLTQWTAEARGSGLAEAAAFVTKLRQDLAAVQAALTLPYSQGQTEGQITRLKALKRQMFGRAGFDLLRTRFLGTPVPAAPT